MRNLQELLEALRREGENDHIGLWEIIGDVKRNSPGSPENLKRTTLQLVAMMLQSGFEAGISRGRSFERWPDQSIEKVVRQIEAEWSELDREPNIGEVVWFNLRE